MSAQTAAQAPAWWAPLAADLAAIIDPADPRSAKRDLWTQATYLSAPAPPSVEHVVSAAAFRIGELLPAAEDATEADALARVARRLVGALAERYARDPAEVRRRLWRGILDLVVERGETQGLAAASLCPEDLARAYVALRRDLADAQAAGAALAAAEEAAASSSTYRPNGRCSTCRADVHWRMTGSGKRAPYNPDGTSHFANCPQASQHRRR